MNLTLLAGGVGGGRMADGFAQQIGEALSVIVNVADDFQLHGLSICPDLDSVTYTLAGISNVEQGWGLAGETYRSQEMLGRLGQSDWFRLGDQDLAVHILRTKWLREGQTLTQVTRGLRQSLGIRAEILPMSDSPVSTFVETGEGLLPFQDYFVKRQHRDKVHSFEFRGIENAPPTREVEQALRGADAVVLAPSNPFVSLAPILAVTGVRPILTDFAGPRVAVSPIIGGHALKGPAGQMMTDMGLECSVLGIARHYQGLLDGLVIDAQDAAHEEELRGAGLKVLCTDTIMRDRPGRGRLAGVILDWMKLVF